ncbi:hypothetical protein HEK131_05870 [Streptomyces seoulensis]|nr:hypothetical protein HEK131_05870 [Streptomyces seoulensis]
MNTSSAICSIERFCSPPSVADAPSVWALSITSELLEVMRVPCGVEGVVVTLPDRCGTDGTSLRFRNLRRRKYGSVSVGGKSPTTCASAGPPILGTGRTARSALFTSRTFRPVCGVLPCDGWVSGFPPG